MRLVVDHDVRLPAMFALTFRDPHELDGTGILKQLGVALGDDVIVSIALNAATTQLMQGEVTSLEVEVEATGLYVVVRGYDKAHRLHRGRKARSWIGSEGLRHRERHRGGGRAEDGRRGLRLTPSVHGAAGYLEPAPPRRAGDRDRL